MVRARKPNSQLRPHASQGAGPAGATEHSRGSLCETSEPTRNELQHAPRHTAPMDHACSQRVLAYTSETETETETPSHLVESLCEGGLVGQVAASLISACHHLHAFVVLPSSSGLGQETQLARHP